MNASMTGQNLHDAWTKATAWLIEHRYWVMVHLLLLGMGVNLIVLFWPQPEAIVMLEPPLVTAEPMTPKPVVEEKTLAEGLTEFDMVLPATDGSENSTLLSSVTVPSFKPQSYRSRHAVHQYAKKALPAAGSVNINTAAKSELMKLPGIGPKTADLIVLDRTQHGAYQSVDELVRVKGIGKKTLEKVKPYIKI